MKEDKLKHLEFIQNVITRMNSTSFQIKGWAITIVTALLGVYASTSKVGFILLALLPTVLFWFLDTYYLMQERKFRGLYNDAAGINADPKELKPFEMRSDLYSGGSFSFWRVFFSKTIYFVYLPLIVILVASYLYLRCN